MNRKRVELAAIAEHESACSRVASHFSRRWLRGYVSSKLRRDPVYRAAYALFRESTRPILDVGCGLGLLGFYLRERGCHQPILGLDLDARKIQEGTQIARERYDEVKLEFHDVRQVIPEFSGDIVLLDLLHYLEVKEQNALLCKLAQCVGLGGVLIVRDGLREKSARYWMTLGAEKFAQVVSWNLNAPLRFPSRAQIDNVFSEAEFDREMRSMWGTTPFNNYLFVFKRKAESGPHVMENRN
jgi:2-polyprenyl-3-methyl-5-hydroxy-6-metoxy-1,4-benzoquinol methylase